MASTLAQGRWDFFTTRLQQLITARELPPLLLLKGQARPTKEWLTNKIVPHFFARASEREEDLLWLGPSGAQYKLEDIENSTWSSFFAHRPVHSPYRVIIFESAEALGERVSNRLLKDLEDTPPWIALIMIYSGEKKIFPTIKSRALTWRLPRQLASTQESGEWLQQLSAAAAQKRYGELPELLRARPISETELMEFFHHSFLAAAPKLHFGHCEKWLTHLRWWQESQTFHQPEWERLLPFCVFASAEQSPSA